MIQLVIISAVLVSSQLHVAAFPEMIAIREPEGMVFEGPIEKEPQLIAPLPHLQRKAEKAMKRREEEKRDITGPESVEEMKPSTELSDSPISRSPSLKSLPSTSFCSTNRKQYEKYCMDFFADVPANSRDSILRFCPVYENRCIRIE